MTARTSGLAEHAAPLDTDLTVTSLVLAWGGTRLRDLPWRRTRDPWSVLVSEVMLQQTQVPRVIPAWQRFLDVFPTAQACAPAPLGDVLRVWQGLGYPRRARNLHTAAGIIASAGGFPSTLDALRALPGVGAYTARAVLAFAFEVEVAVVDTNIARVLARVAGRPLGAREAQERADRLVPAHDSWTWNQALMDLGAMVCRPAPLCAECPIREVCAWHRSGHGPPDPAVASAGVSRRQAPYVGSDREARGRLLRALGVAALERSRVAEVMGRAPDRAATLLDALTGEHLVVIDGALVRLP